MSNTASYIGKEPQYGVFISQAETGDGSTVAFSLDATVATTASLLVSVGGVVQQPAVAYNINSAGTTLTFTAAPGASIPIWILFLGQTLVVPQASSANTTMITAEAALGTTPAAGDYFLVYDADAAAMKKVSYANLESDTADMPANSVKVRDAATTGTPSNKTVADTQLLIGDGTGFTSASLSSDVTMANTGAVTIAADAVTYAKMQNLSTANRVLGSASTGLIGEVQVATDMIADNAVDGTKIAMGSDAAGDILTYTGTNYVRLPKGTGEQQLRMNAGATAVEWATVVSGAAWAIKTGAYTAVNGDGVMVDTSSSAITITLPISSGPPSVGDFVRIMDATGNAATNNITVARNGNNIQGAASDLTISTNRAAIGLVYVNATQGWVLMEN